MDADTVKSLALASGFTEARICRADDAWTAGERLAEFVAQGQHGSMAWMEDTLARRQHPTAMWPDAKSAVVVGLNYGPDIDPLAALERKSEGVISVYARNTDYHDLMKKRLKHFARAFVDKTGAEVKVFVDTAPLMEKPLAAKSGMGWQGKHTNLVSREHGSWLFLGVMLTAAELEPDAPETDHCGSCTSCLDICPTKAFPGPYKLDARRCISYLTIEHKGPIPLEFRAAMGNRIYGCDDCLAVCPWNKFAAVTAEMAFHPRPELKGPLLSELAALDDESFRQVFTASPVKRIGRGRFVRNVMIAIGNSQDLTLLPAVRANVQDEDAMVRGAAIWALSQLTPPEAHTLAMAGSGDEADADVLSEWRSVLAADAAG
ncbi:tRNA epoxyqueuosine(34) reductase QueG [Maricaulis salignorans]|uniref:tRNA epoxyqueuosine(34) reductase QueG n=1 Tax=Maricaulis salignorans TaxID=144026 RepID=UPI003A9210DF